MHRISVRSASSFTLFPLFSSPLDVFTLPHIQPSEQPSHAPATSPSPSEMSKIYEIDPEADTLVVVRPLAEFAAWPGSTSASTTASPSKTADVRIKASSKHLSLASPRFRDLLAQKSATASITSSLSGLGISGHSSGTSNGTVTPTNSGLFAPKSPQLSHGLASPPATPTKSLWRKEAPSSPTLSVVSTASTANNLVSATLVDEADGRVHLELDGVDADAVKTVLNIVHGRAGQDRVPKAVTLDALARIAVVVDRFRLQDAVEIYADRWVDALYRRGIPTTAAARRDLVLWIYVAYVFRRDAIFKEATKIAATQLTGPLPAGALANLPLRAKIVQDIDSQRQHAIAQSLQILAAAVDTLVTQDENESKNENENNSDTYLLGSLLRTLHKNKLYWPQPAAPFDGVSVAAISRAAHDVQTQVWRTAFRTGDTTRSNRTNNQLLLTPKLDSLRAGVTGLDLKSEHGYSLY